MRKPTPTLGPLFVLLLSLAGVAIASHDAHPIDWISGGDPIVLMQGQTYSWKARFCAERLSEAEAAITNASWTTTPTLAVFFTNASTSIGEIKGGPIYTIQHRIAVPQDLRPGVYKGHIAIIGTRSWHTKNEKADRGVIPNTLPLEIHVVEAQ